MALTPDRRLEEGRPPEKNALPVANGFAGLDSILHAVRSSQADLGRYRTALERINSMVSEVLG